jgi:hypothetical protein
MFDLSKMSSASATAAIAGAGALACAAKDDLERCLQLFIRALNQRLKFENKQDFALPDGIAPSDKRFFIGGAYHKLGRHNLRWSCSQYKYVVCFHLSLCSLFLLQSNIVYC